MNIRNFFIGLGMLLFAGGCSEDAPVSEGVPQSSDPGSKDKLTFYSWEDYTEPGVFEEFTKRTGIEVELLTYESTEEMLATVQSQPERYDILITDDITVSHLRELSLIRKLDHGSLSNFKNIESKFRNLEFDKANAYSVPYVWGSTLVAYRKDKISDPEESWSLLWDPAYSGKVMMLNEVQDIFGVTLLAAGRSANAADLKNINFAKERVMEQIRSVDMQFDSYSSILKKLQSGETWVAMNYSGDVAAAAEEMPEIEFFIPKEGALLWLDNFVISRDSKNVDAAHKFIDFMTEPQISAANSNYLWYASPNAAATPFLDEELRGDERIYPTQEVMDKCQFPTPEVQIRREHYLNLAMGDIRKLRRQKDQEKERASIEVTGVGEALK